MADDLNQVSSSNEDDCGEFHIAGVGASAGGLEALESMFSTLPSNSGIAFVVVQHLSPDFKSHMQELLGRQTKMPIFRVENGMRVKPDCVYLIPPKMEMVISEGKLLLTEKSVERKLSHPIDQFFRSLASDIGRYAIGVVLSGTGSDGSRGIRDIHDAGGLVIVQDETSAKFDGMPMNAQATGIVDVVLPPDGISEAIVKYVKEGLSPEALAEQEFVATAAEGVDRIFQLLHQQHNLDFSQYKTSTVSRRIQRRVDLLGLESLDDYLKHVEVDPEEVNNLYKDLLIGVTKFFRDPDAFEVLQREVIPKLVANTGEFKPVRIWVAGCASGEEAYSIAMLVDEEMRRRRHHGEVKIFATDAHHISLHAAARAVYPEEALSELTLERRKRYFVSKRDGFHVVPELRKQIIFAPHNLINDAPFTQMDLVTCRNLLIYLQPIAQKKVLAMFHFALKMSGTLFLGPSETPGDLSDEFVTIDKRWRVYTKRRDVRFPLEGSLQLPVTKDRMPRAAIRTNTAEQKSESMLFGTYDRLLDRKMPPSILVTEHHEMLHTFGGAERYLRTRGGRPSINILDNIHEQLQTPLTGALQHAVRNQDVVRYTGLNLPMPGGNETIHLTVEPIFDPKTQLSTLLITFEPATLPDSSANEGQPVDLSEMTRERIAGLESELRFSQENLQATIEEMETANEELQSTNEELTASNEELQSTNEELHSVNEELYTVNAEHQRRVDELAQANDDMDNLLATTRVGVLFLDNELFLRRFTPEVGRIFHLVPQDIGRSIEGFTHNFDYETLVEDLRESLREEKEKEVDVTDRQGTNYVLRMHPYRSGAEVQGVVLTLINVDRLRQAQLQVERFKYMADSSGDLFSLLNRDGNFCYVNPIYEEVLGYSRQEILEMSVPEVDPNYSREVFQSLFDDAQTQRIPPFETVMRHKDGHLIPFEITVSTVDFEDDRYMFATAREISQRLESEAEMRSQHLAIESATNGILISDATKSENPIVYCNSGFRRLTGYAEEEIIGNNCRFLQGPDTDPTAVARIRRAIELGESCQATILNYRKDGTEFWNDLQVTPVHDKDGKLVNFVGVQHDVSEQREMLQQLELANGRMRQSERAAKIANQAKSEFLANMSHEIRTPMAAILGHADVLLQHLTNPDDRSVVTTISRNGRLLLDIINDILDLSRIEAGKFEIDLQQVNLPDLIADIASLIAVRAEEKAIELRVVADERIPKTINTDEKRLKQILFNLLGNAIKFTDEGHVELRVSIVGKEHDSKLRFDVTDTGIGMSASHMSSLFQPFSQGDASVTRQYGGSGLGLAISERLTEMLQGDLSLESELNVGSKFTLEIPIGRVDSEDLIQMDLSKSSSNAEDDTKLRKLSCRVLLVDDRRDVRHVAEHFLTKAGATVSLAADGNEAVAAVKQSEKQGSSFDVVVMDMQMPNKDGYTATSELRAAGYDMPIIALTAEAMRGDRERCLAAGCDEYMSKPIVAATLIKLVAQLTIDRSRDELRQMREKSGDS